NDEKKSKLSIEVFSFLYKFYYLVEILNKESDSYDYLDFVDFKNVVNILVNSRNELEEYLNFLTYKKELFDLSVYLFV
ncbi:hypothetical protein, partial [Mycoplasmopsis bovis]|uniref:hypothetical protein n=1 Tax=Mycoplasmopsis bovis TaxID=28903 RepID=UPI003D2B4EA8